MVNVAFFPGWLGSTIGYLPSIFGYRYPIWPNPASIPTGDLVQLQLAADGRSPGPLTHGLAVSAIDVIGAVYGPIVQFMQTLGWNLLPVPIDWRLSLQDSGKAALSAVQAQFGGEPFAIVAHSHGGLVARSAYQWLVQAGQGTQLTRLVTLGTPHYGTMQGVLCLFRQQVYYTLLQSLCGWVHFGIPPWGPDYIDATIASFPAIYELMPFKDYGYLLKVAPDQIAALYQSNFWGSANPHFSAARLNAASAGQDWIQPAMPAGLLYTVAGIGYRTEVGLNLDRSQTTDAGYTSSADGDGIVSIGYTTVPGSGQLVLRCDHVGLVQSSAVWQSLYGLVVSGFPGPPPIPA